MLIKLLFLHEEFLYKIFFCRTHSAFSEVPFPSRGKKLDKEIFAKILPTYLAKPFDFSKPNYLGSRALVFKRAFIPSA